MSLQDAAAPARSWQSNRLAVDLPARRAQQVQVRREDRRRFGQARGILGRKRLPAHRGARRAGVHAVDAYSRGARHLVGEHLHEALGAELGCRIGAPVGAPDAADRARREHDRGVVRLAQQRQQRARQQECRGQVDVQHLAPGRHVVLLDRDSGRRGCPRRARARRGGRTRRSTASNRAVVLGRGRGFEVEGQQRRLRPAFRDDPIIGADKLALRAAEQCYRGTLAGEREAQRLSDAVARAGDEDDASCVRTGGRRVGTRRGLRRCRIRARDRSMFFRRRQPRGGTFGQARRNLDRLEFLDRLFSPHAEFDELARARAARCARAIRRPH